MGKIQVKDNKLFEGGILVFISVNELPLDFIGEHYCVVGAGPSLDLCEEDILQFIEKKVIFILSDVIALYFIQKFPQSKRLVITVEKRSHVYLKQLQNEHIFFYHGVRRDNLPQKNFLYPFYLSHEHVAQISSLPKPMQKKLFHLVSPGTVGGLSLSLAFFLLLYHPKVKPREKKTNVEKKVFCMGLDFSYPDVRVFSRYANIFLPTTRFYSRESYELITVFKKTSTFDMKMGQVIRGSAEFGLAAENCARLIESLPPQVQVEDFSPLGINSVRIKKRVPTILAVP